MPLVIFQLSLFDKHVIYVWYWIMRAIHITLLCCVTVLLLVDSGIDNKLWETQTLAGGGGGGVLKRI